MQRRIILGAYVLSSSYKDAYYIKAPEGAAAREERLRRCVREVRCGDGADDTNRRIQGGREVRRSASAVTFPTLYTVSCNLAGIPGLEHAVRFHQVCDLPIGLQLLGDAFRREKLFRIARMYEAATDCAHETSESVESWYEYRDITNTGTSSRSPTASGSSWRRMSPLLPRTLPSGDVGYELHDGRVGRQSPPGEIHGRRQARFLAI